MNFKKIWIWLRTVWGSIQVDFEDKVITLVQNFGTLSLNDSIYQRQILESQMYVDTLAINDKLWLIEREILYNIFLLENIENAPQLLGVFQQLDTLQQQLDTLQLLLSESSNEEDRNRINAKIMQLNDERDVAEEQIELEREKQIALLKEKLNQKKIELQAKKEARIKKFKEDISAISDSTSGPPVPIRDFYSLNDNVYFVNYLNDNENVRNG